jgi:hypothetical protein
VPENIVSPYNIFNKDKLMSVKTLFGGIIIWQGVFHVMMVVILHAVVKCVIQSVQVLVVIIYVP